MTVLDNRVLDPAATADKQEADPRDPRTRLEAFFDAGSFRPLGGRAEAADDSG
ncbi:MAG: acyl-CoA carboxylase subunit beta, partial [Actinomadura rubrobrunea]|nr:acyl-CoA carboxylase subunit beta [Actinomadura rubrobrunea]